MARYRGAKPATARGSEPVSELTSFGGKVSSIANQLTTKDQQGTPGRYRPAADADLLVKITEAVAAANEAEATGSSRLPAEQIAGDCPTEIRDLGKRIAAHLEKAERCEAKANDHRIAAGKLLAQAREACDEGGFNAFRERFCPNLGRSRAYDLLAIASGKKTIEDRRAVNAERNRQYRAKKKAAASPLVAEVVHHVMDELVAIAITGTDPSDTSGGSRDRTYGRRGRGRSSSAQGAQGQDRRQL